jgi:hypothetical protein
MPLQLRSFASFFKDGNWLQRGKKARMGFSIMRCWSVTRIVPPVGVWLSVIFERLWVRFIGWDVG